MHQAETDFRHRHLQRLALSGRELARVVGDFCCTPFGAHISEGDASTSSETPNAHPAPSGESGHLMEWEDDVLPEAIQGRRLRKLDLQFMSVQQGQDLVRGVSCGKRWHLFHYSNARANCIAVHGRIPDFQAAAGLADHLRN